MDELRSQLKEEVRLLLRDELTPVVKEEIRQALYEEVKETLSVELSETVRDEVTQDIREMVEHEEKERIRREMDILRETLTKKIVNEISTKRQEHERQLIKEKTTQVVRIKTTVASTEVRTFAAPDSRGLYSKRLQQK